jgi:hypothetical protein
MLYAGLRRRLQGDNRGDPDGDIGGDGLQRGRSREPVTLSEWNRGVFHFLHFVTLERMAEEPVAT